MKTRTAVILAIALVLSAGIIGLAIVIASRKLERNEERQEQKPLAFSRPQEVLPPARQQTAQPAKRAAAKKRSSTQAGRSRTRRPRPRPRPEPRTPPEPTEG